MRCPGSKISVTSRSGKDEVFYPAINIAIPSYVNCIPSGESAREAVFAVRCKARDVPSDHAVFF